MQYLSRLRCNFKIARVNQVRFSVRFVAAISQRFRTCLKLVATSARQKLHPVAATKIACVNGPLEVLWKISHEPPSLLYGSRTSWALYWASITNRDYKAIIQLVIWLGSLEGNPRVLIGSFLVGISPYGPFAWKRSKAAYILISKAGKFKTSTARGPHNKLLANLACSSRTGNIGPRSVLSWPQANISQYGPHGRLVRGYC